MNVVNRIAALERLLFPKTCRDEDRDRMIQALVGNNIECYKSRHYTERDGWDLIGVLDDLAPEVWEDYEQEG